MASHIPIKGQLSSHVISSYRLLTQAGLLCKAFHQTNRLTTRTSRLGSTRTSHIHSLASIALIEEVTAAFVALTLMVPIGGCQGLVPALLSCKAAEVVVQRLPSSQTYRGPQLLAHEAVAPLLKLHVRNPQPYPRRRPTQTVSTLTTTRSAHRKIYV
jgi:hypothetical protein